LWRTREAKCLEIIEKALALLQQSPPFPMAENDINRQFYFCLLEASRILYPDDEVAPLIECSNQPDQDDEARASRDMKRPDFQWVFLDRYAADPTRSSRQFVVECKRLGKAPRRDWVLNLNYVNHGIERFRNAEWGYAKLMPTGAMVGYWQDLPHGVVLSAVNGECQAQAFSELDPVDPIALSPTSRFEHTFKRSFEGKRPVLPLCRSWSGLCSVRFG
jgi:hypothetical protein